MRHRRRMHVTNGEIWVSQACASPTLRTDSSGEARIDDVRIHIAVQVVGRNADQAHPPGQHAPRRPPRRPLHAPLRVEHADPPGGTEVVVDLEHALRPSDVQTVDVLKVRRGEGNTHLEPGRAVLSVRGPEFAWIRELREGQRLRIETDVVRAGQNDCGATNEAPGWGDIQEALSGTTSRRATATWQRPSWRASPTSPGGIPGRTSASRPTDASSWSPSTGASPATASA